MLSLIRLIHVSGNNIKAEAYMAGRLEFKEKLGDILKEAVAQGGEMQKEEVEKFFSEDGLSEEQIDLVCDYLLFLLQLNVILFSKE